MNDNILYRDRQLLVCKKPQGMPSQPDLSGQLDLLTALQREIPTATLVHRLDTPTGGVMLYAAQSVAAGKLSALVQDHTRFVKEYLAVIPQPIQPECGEMTDFLFHDKRRNKAFTVEKKRGGSKEAKLCYETVSTAENGRTLIRIRLYTGRTHQIRVQFASRGFPLCGDGKYGSRIKTPYIALWSYRTAFTHPFTGQSLDLCSLPDAELVPWSDFDLGALERSNA